MFPPQRRQPLLLRVRVDVRPNHERDDVEKGDPDLLRQELLRKGQRDRRRDPRHLHHGHEAGADGGADLVEGSGAGDEGHGDEIDGVLDGRELWMVSFLSLKLKKKKSIFGVN